MAAKISSKYITRKNGKKKKKDKDKVAKEMKAASVKAGKEKKTTVEISGAGQKRQTGSVAVSPKTKHKTTTFKKTPGYDPKTGKVKGQGEHRKGEFKTPPKPPEQSRTKFTGAGGNLPPYIFEGKKGRKFVGETVKQAAKKGDPKTARRTMVTTTGAKKEAPLSRKGKSASETEGTYGNGKKKKMKGRKKRRSRKPKY